MKAQDIIPRYEAVVAEYDVDKLLCDYVDADLVVEDIVRCIASHTSPTLARGVYFTVKDIVNGVLNGNHDYKEGGRAEELTFVFDKDFFLGYDTERGIVLRRRA